MLICTLHTGWLVVQMLALLNVTPLHGVYAMLIAFNLIVLCTLVTTYKCCPAALKAFATRLNVGPAATTEHETPEYEGEREPMLV
eukprot:SAG11_NODE_2712_length_3053_cov_2.161083_2_plen_85_part_00